MGFWGQIGEGVVRYWPLTNSSFLLGVLTSVPLGENRSRNATVRVLADGQTDTLTDANRFYNLSHAICYSYGTDNNKDGKLPDGCTLIPWCRGKPLAWDVTVCTSVANSYLVAASHAAEQAADRKCLKYTELSATYEFQPAAVETHGPL